MTKICPKCSKNKTENKYCNDCYISLINLELITKYELIKCDDCSSVFISGKDYKNISKILFEQLLLKQIKLKNDCNYKTVFLSKKYYNYDRKAVHFNIPDIRFIVIKGNFTLELNQFDNNSDGVLTIPFNVEFRLLYNKCKICQRRDSKYFEGTFQLRCNKNEFETDTEMFNFLTDLRELLTQYEDNITSEGMTQNGFDLVVLNKKRLADMANLVLNNVVGESKHNTTLFSRNHQSSKNVYRDTTLAKVRNLVLSDYVMYNDELFNIVKIRSKEVLIRSLKNNLNINVLKYLDKVVKIHASQIKEVEVLNNNKNNITVLDPDTFESKSLMNDCDLTKAQKKIKIIKINDELYGV